MTTILIIEDETELVKVLKSYLENIGYSVITATRGDQGLTLWNQKNPDLVLLDLNLPGMDGLDIVREIRKTSQTPIIMITARVEESDQMIGLEIGADDYITKPFSPKILVSRVRALLRRSYPIQDTGKQIRIADLFIDVDAFQLEKNHQAVDLTATEFRLLVVLASNPGRTFSRIQLLEVIQGETFVGYERSVDAHIKNLRAKIETNPKEPQLIQTVFGVGYRFAKD